MSNPTLRDLTGMSPDPAPISTSALVLIDCQQTYREGVMQLEGVFSVVPDPMTALASLQLEHADE